MLDDNLNTDIAWTAREEKREKIRLSSYHFYFFILFYHRRLNNFVLRVGAAAAPGAYIRRLQPVKKRNSRDVDNKIT